MSRVAVIGGGASCEHDVSLASAAGVADALATRHDVVRLTIGPDGSWAGGLPAAAHSQRPTPGCGGP